MSRARAMPDARVLWSVPELTVSTAGAKMGKGDGGGDTVEEVQGSAIEANRQEKGRRKRAVEAAARGWLVHQGDTQAIRRHTWRDDGACSSPHVPALWCGPAQGSVPMQHEHMVCI